MIYKIYPIAGKKVGWYLLSKDNSAIHHTHNFSLDAGQLMKDPQQFAMRNEVAGKT